MITMSCGKGRGCNYEGEPELRFYEKTNSRQRFEISGKSVQRSEKNRSKCPYRDYSISVFHKS